MRMEKENETIVNENYDFLLFQSHQNAYYDTQ